MYYLEDQRVHTKLVSKYLESNRSTIVSRELTSEKKLQKFSIQLLEMFFNAMLQVKK